MRLISFTSLFDWLWNTTNNSLVLILVGCLYYSYTLGSVPLSYYKRNRPLFFFSISFAVVCCFILPLQLISIAQIHTTPHHTAQRAFIHFSLVCRFGLIIFFFSFQLCDDHCGWYSKGVRLVSFDDVPEHTRF